MKLSSLDTGIKILILLIIFLFSFCSCTPFAPAPRKKTPDFLPGEYAVGNQTRVKMPERWWRVFNSSELNSLMQNLWQGNLKLEQA